MGHAIVILGANGGVGSGIVDASLAAGLPTIAVSRDEEGLDALAARVAHNPLLTCLPASLDDETSARSLVIALRNLRVRPAAVVASLNAPLDNGRLADRPSDFLASQLDANVLVHFRAARAIVPWLSEISPGALYLALGGGAADHPWAGHGHISVSAAALKMMFQVLRNEWSALPVRVQLLQIDSIVKTWRNETTACPDWLAASEVGREVLSLARHSDGNPPVVHLGRGCMPRARVAH